ncbi:glycosyltransferase family 2 protein [Prolixibacteraceae bacterium Z1-6]|uniref:Glycosyltransferase family 2 protein n=1 Tax=Draconibacterium aestuarii TaxID=2998507 RepID=A0A9X3F5V3_9BACT|nr:glycosyltransferase family 2 protein [Prolixibacteraceae bacterium Z1-6]
MKISIVIPSFNEEDNIALLFEKIKTILQKEDYECIFVDDGSRDATFENIRKIAAENKQVKGISFSRNFGHQTALLAGLTEADGDVVIMMDADGQHPPEVIPELLNQYQKGFEIVNTRRLSTGDAGAAKNLSSKGYYKFVNLLTDIKIEPASSDFRLMTRKAVDAFLQIDEKDRFTRGLISWMGFKQTIVEFTAPPRMTGVSKYTFKKMLTFAWDGITSFSSKPLKFSLYAGIFALLFGGIYSIYILIIFIMGKTIPGWASMMLVILLLGGIQLLSLGIIGEYLSRIFNEAKNRPHYFIQDRC